MDDDRVEGDLADAWLYMDRLESRLAREGDRPVPSNLRLLLPARRWHTFTDHQLGAA